MAKMKMQKVTHNMKRAVYSGTRALTLASIVAAVVFAFPSTVWSQTPEWTVYNTANSGLPYNGVTALAIDAQGNAWVGTGKWWAHAGGGLVKFDGTNWTVYNTSNSQLPDNDHVSLSIDAQGNIWSGTEGGLSKFDGVNWTVYRTNNSGLPSNHTGAPAFDAEGNAWIGTFPSGGLAKFDGANWTVYNTGNCGVPSNFITGVAIDAQANIWAGTLGNGVAKFDGENWTVYNRTNSGLPHNDTSFLSTDGQGSVWIGTYGGGLAKFDGTIWRAYTTANSGLPDDWIWNLNVDSMGNVLAGTKAGLARFDGVNWRVYNTTNSGLPDNNVYCIAFDAEGKIWVGTQDGGLAVFHPQPVVDFNGDGVVDIKDLLKLIESWGQDDPVVDIAPPFGDGAVDILDLELLMSYWEQPVDDPTLIAHWALDEAESAVAFDSAGVTDAFVIGGTAWQPSGGQVDGALQLDGVDGCAVAGPVLSPADGPFSVFAWVKGGAPGQVILSQQGAGNWLTMDTAGNLMTELKGPDRSAGPLQSQTTITDGDWHRVGFVWDGTKRILYVDDVAAAEDTQVNLQGSDGGLYIGTGKMMQPGTYFSGLIDDVRIYNRAVSP
jgi:ligand-binding sensor domain-containing protein